MQDATLCCGQPAVVNPLPLSDMAACGRKPALVGTGSGSAMGPTAFIIFIFRFSPCPQMSRHQGDDDGVAKKQA
jgi:hypothetical protein